LFDLISCVGWVEQSETQQL